jgi:hypothetical protein
MKKIVVFSVLLALLSAAAFADDSGWAIGFTAQLSRNFFYTTKATGEYEYTKSGSPANTTTWPTDGTYTGKFGENVKGSSHLWTWTGANPWDHDTSRPDNRLIVSLANNGDHHSIYIDAKLDNSWVTGPTLMGLLNGDAADWSFSGDTGASGAAVVFDGKVGTGRYGGFVPAYEFWNDWIQSGDYNFFGVMTQGGYVQSDYISVVNFLNSPWDAVYAVGATFGGNFRVALGSTLNRDTPSWAGGHAVLMKGFDDDNNLQAGSNNAVASLSRARGAFMVSGRDLGPLAFDLFYGVNGGDNNTAIRHIIDPTDPLTLLPSGRWENLIGAYIGLNIVENLGLSVGYTANFIKFETAQVNKEYADTTKKPNYVTQEIETPIWSGVDIKVKFDGIDKMGITFNNNLSFASAAGAEVKNPGDTIVLGLDYDPLYVGGDASTAAGKVNTNTQNWFAWTGVIGVSYSLTDNLGVTLGILDLLNVYSTEYDWSGPSSSTKNSKATTTNNELRVGVTASYGVGNVSFGSGLVLQMNSKTVETEENGSGTGYSSTETFKGSSNTVKFSIPVFFKVSI